MSLRMGADVYLEEIWINLEHLRVVEPALVSERRVPHPMVDDLRPTDRPAGSEDDPVSIGYNELRERYRPERVRLLLVAESPPDPRSGELRFFYAPRLTADNLYRSVALALYGQDPAFNERDKQVVLERMQRDGVWLVDAVDVPVNALSDRERNALVVSSVPELIEKCKAADPSVGVIICKRPVFAAVAGPLRDAGIKVLHEQPLPFPLGNWRAKFIEGMRTALSASEWLAS